MINSAIKKDHHDCFAVKCADAWLEPVSIFLFKLHTCINKFSKWKKKKKVEIIFLFLLPLAWFFFKKVIFLKSELVRPKSKS